ncbi:hypothetical protein GQF02_10875 [Neisseriaceae bacterium B2N2-7]|uniref:Tyrosine specific protein phosphatases domain-containing protein n=2 Tax=Craterilacuibacter sinensis TaxID=2686017 RepID=A0A845BQP0_9NEIS|nr:hypothetical protein [Craterilacuibacter sinensis]
MWRTRADAARPARSVGVDMMLPSDACQGLPLRRGMLFRAGVLSTHDAALIAPARALGIRHVIDFRSVHERDNELCLWGALLGVRSQRAPVASDVRASDAASDALIAAFIRQPDAGAARTLMRVLYHSFGYAFLPHLRTLLAPLALGEPLLVHCTAGKDRTGFACALIASAAGVPYPQVIDNYLTHGQQAACGPQAARLRQMLANYLWSTPDDATLAALSGVDASYLDTAFDVLLTRHGSIEAYLAAGGIDAAMLAKVRTTLVHER